MKILGLTLIAATLALTGCQTAKRGSTSQVRIHVQPPGANVTTSLGHVCTAPCSLKIKRRSAFTVTASKKGYRSRSVQVKRILNKQSFRRTAAAGIVLPGGSALAIVDAASGAYYDHAPNPVRIRLSRR